MERITQVMTDESAAAIPPGATPTRETVTAVVDAQRKALNALEALDPPEELAPEHLALMVVFTDFVVRAEEFLGETADLDGVQFRAALDTSTDIDVLAERVADACDALRGRARAVGHPVALEC